MSQLIAIVAFAGLFGLAGAETITSLITPNLWFNWTFAIHDPPLMLQPDSLHASNASAPFTNLWNITFKDTPWSSFQPGVVGLGASHGAATYNESNGENRQSPSVYAVSMPFSNVYLKGEAKALEGRDGKVLGLVDLEVATYEVLSDGWIASMSIASTPYRSHDAVFAVVNGTWKVDGLVGTMGIKSAV